jgi:PAS domain S-box-containing protein
MIESNQKYSLPHKHQGNDMRLILLLTAILFLSILNIIVLLITDLPHTSISIIIAFELLLSIIALYYACSFHRQIRTFANQLLSGKPPTSTAQLNTDIPLQKLFTVSTAILKQKNDLETFKEQYEPVISGSDEGFWDVDLLSKEIVISKKIKQMLGYEESELHNDFDTIAGIIHEDDRAMVCTTVKNCIDSRQTRFTIEFRMNHKNGSIRWFVSNGIVVRYPDGKAHRITGTQTDITVYKLLEQRLRGSEEQLKLTFDATGEGIWDWVIREGLIRHNKRWCEILGLDESKLVHTFDFFGECIHPKDRRLVFQKVNDALAPGVFYECEYRMYRSDGTIIWVQDRGSVVVRSEQGEPLRMMGSIADITSRKIAQLALTVKDQKIRSLFQSMNDLVFLLDKNMIFEEYIQPVSSDLILPPEQFIGRSISDIGFPQDAHELIVSALNRVKRTQTPGRVEYSMPIPSGNVEWFDMHITPILDKDEDDKEELAGFTCVSRDITEQKKNGELLEILVRIAGKYINLPIDQVEHTIKESIREMGVFVEADRTYIFDYDFADNTCSNTYEWCRDGVHPEIDNLQKVSLDKIPQWVEHHSKGLELYYDNVPGLADNNPSKEILEAQGIKSMLCLPMIYNDELLGFVGFDSVRNYYIYSEKEKMLLKVFAQMLVNIKLRKNSIEQLSVAKEEAETANRAKSEFLANMSHEIRTPLNAVIGFANLLKRTKLDTIQKQYTDHAFKAGQALLSIINDILDLSKIEAERLELEIVTTDLPELIEQSANIIRYDAESKGIRFLVELAKDLPRYAAIDPVRVRQILINLLTNAVKFTEKGYVALRLQAEKHNDTRTSLHFEVEDTGIGISDAQKQKLFKSFSQADASTTRKYGGTGLGLAISNFLAQKMGSTISVKSAIGKGSNFSFSIETECCDLPDQLQKTSVSLQQAKSSPTPLDGNFVMIIADDVAFNIDIVVGFLRDFAPGAEIITAENGQKVIDILKQKTADIIFMDIHMPVLDGIEATRSIRTSELCGSRRTPIIAFTAGALKEEQEKCLAAGMDAFLTKPIDPDELIGTIHRFFGNNADRTVPAVNQPEQSPINELPVFPDIDIKTALAWADNDLPRLKQMFTKFLTMYNDAPEKIRSLFNSGALTELASFAHSMRGASSMIGGKKLGEVLSLLETALRNQPDINHEKLIGETLASLESFFSNVHTLISKITDP